MLPNLHHVATSVLLKLAIQLAVVVGAPNTSDGAEILHGEPTDKPHPRPESEVKDGRLERFSCRFRNSFFDKLPRPEDSEVTLSVFESSCHLLLPV